MSAHEIQHEDDGQLHAHGTIFQRIWRPFIILFLVTALEFLVAFTLPKGGLKVAIFILMTLVKAFYIVAYFMHVKFERLNLAMAIVLPFLFIVYLIALLMLEGGHVFRTMGYGS
ncbi:MAG: cytochrome C oxidase subunit IV family protein [Bacteroidia bacterium]|nr:cytochrome C oxidase subunit IV family protein [Bacteroidia bacterium]MDW8333507.1 cytochrome C oxidase subunit IV family protein [Bacteroidia bacterium]